MCGRYVAAADPEQLREVFETGPVPEVLPPNYNVAPTQPVYVVDELSGGRQLRVVQWGLVPNWAKDRSLAGKMINARAETVAEKPSFRTPFARTRCLVPATGWYEWQSIGIDPKATKQPFYLFDPAGQPVAFAGLLDAWRDPADGQVLRTMAVITVPACAELEGVHDRMPALLSPGEWSTWLDPDQSPARLLELLRPAAPGTVAIRKVATTVNSNRASGPHLIDAV